MKKIQVTQRAYLARVQRALAKDGQQLKKNRGGRAIQEFGDYCLLERNVIQDSGDLSEIVKRRGLKILAPYEEVA